MKRSGKRRNERERRIRRLSSLRRTVKPRVGRKGIRLVMNTSRSKQRTKLRPRPQTNPRRRARCPRLKGDCVWCVKMKRPCLPWWIVVICACVLVSSLCSRHFIFLYPLISQSGWLDADMQDCSDLVMATSKECPLCRTRIVTSHRLIRIYKV